ncbi:MAG: hypothetical protein FJW68_10010, partial [Actinobacteria bacterium]|nr:hypothetical protein [Actinomycetota bacterium]
MNTDSLNNNCGTGGIKYFYAVDDVIEDIKEGRVLIIADDKSNDNEGVLFQAAEKVTSHSMNFFMTHGKGLIYMPAEHQRLEELKIPAFTISGQHAKNISDVSMPIKNTSGPTLAMSIDSAKRKGSGASASDRALTVKAFADKDSKPQDFIMPGHVFPLKYHEGGVLARAGHTEAAVDLARIAGLFAAGIIC